MNQPRQQGSTSPGVPINVQPVDTADLRRWADAGVLYAVLDACVSPAIRALAETMGPDRAACLYLGGMAENFGDKAPYLLRADESLIAWIAQTLGDQPWGCFLLSDAGFDRVRRQLRHFLTATPPTGEPWLFRFYDPRLLPTFLKSSTSEELNAFFGPIDAFMSIGPDGTGHSIRRSGEIVGKPRRRAVGERFRLSNAHIAAFRRQQIGDELIRSFDGTPQRAHRDPANDDILVDNPDGGTMRLSHDAQGFVGGVTSPLGRQWALANDPSGKLLSLRLPSGSTLDLDYDGAGRIAQVSRDGRLRFRAGHDEYGRLDRVAFPDGSEFSTRYCDTGRAGMVDPDGLFVAEESDRLNRVERFDYDGDALIATIDGNGNATRFDYRASAHPDALIYPDGTREAYRYDPAGHLQALVRADDSGLQITCDKNGRPVRIVADDGQEASFDYDEAGRLVAAANADGTVTWCYDEAGQLLEERSGDTAIGYGYDASGTPDSLTYPTGETVRFEHDADRRLQAIVDWSGRRYAMEHAPDDQGWRLLSPDGIATTSWRNPAGFTTAMQVQKGDTALFESAFAYDDEDRLRERRDTRLGTTLYDYDAEAQIVRTERSSGRAERFVYDAAGNRVACAEGGATFNALNQLLTQGDTQCRYDARGNLIERSGAAKSWHYRYDGFNRLASAEDSYGQSVTFGYDALGRRIWKRVTSGPSGARTTRYIWAGEQIIREIVETSAGSQARDYLYWPRTSTPLLLREAGAVFQYHTDPGGVPIRLTDAHGETAWEADYDAFGEARVLVDRVTQPWRLPGQYHDVETGLHYNRMRYYDPALGRYISRDPIGVAGGLNLYLYAGNNPIGRDDPLGLWGWKGIVSVVAAVAVAAVVVATAPISGPLLLIAAGAAAGAVGFGLNEALNEKHFCAACIAKAALKGALIGAASAVPFLFLPEAAGVAAYMGAGAASGFIGYAGDVALTPGMKWNWGDAAKATALGAALGPLGKLMPGSRARPEPVPEEPPVSYERPSGFRKGVRDKAWDAAKGPDGQVRNPGTDEVMDPNEPWDMGHKPGYEFRKHQQSAIDRGITRKQFLDEHNDPSHYRPEIPSYNRSHQGEDLTDDYLGY